MHVNDVEGVRRLAKQVTPSSPHMGIGNSVSVCWNIAIDLIEDLGNLIGYAVGSQTCPCHPLRPALCDGAREVSRFITLGTIHVA